MPQPVGAAFKDWLRRKDADVCAGSCSRCAERLLRFFCAQFVHNKKCLIVFCSFFQRLAFATRAVEVVVVFA